MAHQHHFNHLFNRRAFLQTTAITAVAPFLLWHAIISILACEQGKDVYCEKPLSLTIAEARAMANAVRKYDRVFQTGSMQRSDITFHKGCELVRNGAIGTVKEVWLNRERRAPWDGFIGNYWKA